MFVTMSMSLLIKRRQFQPYLVSRSRDTAQAVPSVCFVAKSQLLIFEKTALSATDVDEGARPCTRSILVFTASGATASACRPIASAPSRIFRPCSRYDDQ